MTSDPISRKSVGNILTKQILPRVAGGHVPLILAYPPVIAPGSPITPRVAPLLRTIRGSNDAMTTAHWIEEGFNTARCPVLIWVVEGEADFRIGMTRRMVRLCENLSPRHGYYVAALPTHSLFFVPPGTPISDASRPHWERPDLLKAHCQLLWFHLASSGVSLHTCTTSGEEHTTSYGIFCSEDRLLPIAEVLGEELQNRTLHSEALVHHYLAAFFLLLHRALSAPRAIASKEHVLPAGRHHAAASDAAVQRACHYIEAKLSQKISIAQIAAHAYISPTQLNRLFRSELKTSIGEYVTQRRLEQARSLLQATALPVNYIGQLCGYPKPEYFNQIFRQHSGLTPGAFRRGKGSVRSSTIRETQKSSIS